MKRISAALAVLVVLTGCATQGELKQIKVAMPRGETATIMAHEQSVPDWMLDRSQMKLNFLVRGDVTEEQFKAVASVQDSCRIYTDTVRAPVLVNVIINGVVYGVAGALGSGIGATLAFANAQFSDYAKYGGAAGAFNGMASGIISSGGATYTFENCSSQILAMFPHYGVRVLQKSSY